MLTCPNEISFSLLDKKKSFSSSNYSEIFIPNKNQKALKDFLDDDKPFITGIEPGSNAYVKYSDIYFLRNSCIDLFNLTQQNDKLIYLNPRHSYSNELVNKDVLLCKDANIGDACLFLEEQKKCFISSGVVKLNFKNDLDKFYCLAMMRDTYFRDQLYALTPKGSTIKHAGDKFLQCKLPAITKEIEGYLDEIKNLILNLAYCESISYQKMNQIERIFLDELKINEAKINHETSFDSVSEVLRLDSGMFSEEVKKIQYAVENYINGSLSLEDFGFKLKRGPNLAKRDLGRSVQSNQYRDNFNVLIYPSDISDNGYVLKQSYLGARNEVSFMTKGDILFSAEGTVGKTFIVCDESLKFTTNFHGIILSKLGKDIPFEKSIILGCYLIFLRKFGFFEKISVGGQGGSFAIQYWDYLKVPNIPKDLYDQFTNLYYISDCNLNPSKFDEISLQKSGIFNLNNFRIACSERLKAIVDSIKSA